MGASPSFAATLDYVVLAGLGVFFLVVFGLAVVLIRHEAKTARDREAAANGGQDSL